MVSPKEIEEALLECDAIGRKLADLKLMISDSEMAHMLLLAGDPTLKNDLSRKAGQPSRVGSTEVRGRCSSGATQARIQTRIPRSAGSDCREVQRKCSRNRCVRVAMIIDSKKLAKNSRIAQGRGIAQKADLNRRFRVADFRETFLCPICLAPTSEIFKQLEDGQKETGIAVIACSINHAEKIIAAAREQAAKEKAAAA